MYVSKKEIGLVAGLAVAGAAAGIAINKFAKHHDAEDEIEVAAADAAEETEVEVEGETTAEPAEADAADAATADPTDGACVASANVSADQDDTTI